MKHRRSEHGVALIICLFALMLLSGIGLGMMYMADTESSINRNYRDAQQAYFAAAAGIQEARERLTPTSTTILAPPTTLPNNGASTGVVYIINYTSSIAGTAIQPWTSGNAYFDTELCHENFSNAGTALVPNTGPNTPCAAVPTGTYYTKVNSNSPFLGSDSNLPYRWVRITQKVNAAAVPATPSTLHNSFYVNAYNSANNVPICWNGTAELPLNIAVHGATCDVDPPLDGTYMKSVYMLTALAVTQNGSRRMVQMEVANNPPFLTNAALDTNDFVTVKGSSVTVNGNDNCKCSCTTAKGAAAPVCTDRTSGATCSGSTYAIYSSQTVSQSGNPALVAGRPDHVAVAENQFFPYDVPALINKYKTMTGAVNTSGPPYNMSCPGTPPNCGSSNTGTFGTVPNPFPPTDPSNPVGAVNQITYVPGSVDLQAHSTGSGVLVIDGDLTIHGGINFYGLIIVRGVLTFAGSGSGQDVGVYGSIITGNSSIADDSLKGGVSIQYDRCALLNTQTASPPALLANHEVSY